MDETGVFLLMAPLVIWGGNVENLLTEGSGYGTSIFVGALLGETGGGLLC
jgi:hypothetical protein